MTRTITLKNYRERHRKKSILILFYIMGFKEEKIDDSNYFEGMEEILEENRVQNRALYLHRPFDSCE